MPMYRRVCGILNKPSLGVSLRFKRDPKILQCTSIQYLFGLYRNLVGYKSGIRLQQRLQSLLVCLLRVACNAGSPQTHYVDKHDFEFLILLTPPQGVLRLQGYNTMPSTCSSGG